MPPFLDLLAGVNRSTLTPDSQRSYDALHWIFEFCDKTGSTPEFIAAILFHGQTPQQVYAPGDPLQSPHWPAGSGSFPREAEDRWLSDLGFTRGEWATIANISNPDSRGLYARARRIFKTVPPIEAIAPFEDAIRSTYLGMKFLASQKRTTNYATWPNVQWTEAPPFDVTTLNAATDEQNANRHVEEVVRLAIEVQQRARAGSITLTEIRERRAALSLPNTMPDRIQQIHLDNAKNPAYAYRDASAELAFGGYLSSDLERDLPKFGIPYPEQEAFWKKIEITEKVAAGVLPQSAVDNYKDPVPGYNALWNPKFAQVSTRSFFDSIVGATSTLIGGLLGTTGKVLSAGYISRGLDNLEQLALNPSDGLKALLKDFTVMVAIAGAAAAVAAYTGVAGTVMQSMGGFTDAELAAAGLIEASAGAGAEVLGPPPPEAPPPPPEPPPAPPGEIGPPPPPPGPPAPPAPPPPPLAPPAAVAPPPSILDKLKPVLGAAVVDELRPEPPKPPAAPVKPPAAPVRPAPPVAVIPATPVDDTEPAPQAWTPARILQIAAPIAAVLLLLLFFLL